MDLSARRVELGDAPAARAVEQTQRTYLFIFGAFSDGIALNQQGLFNDGPHITALRAGQIGKPQAVRTHLSPTENPETDRDTVREKDLDSSPDQIQIDTSPTQPKPAPAISNTTVTTAMLTGR